MNRITNRILFFYRNGIAYYKYQENIKKIDTDTIWVLKNKLELPYGAEFIGFSRAEIGRIISGLCDEQMDYIEEDIPDKHGLLHFRVIFSKKKENTISDQRIFKRKKEKR